MKRVMLLATALILTNCLSATAIAEESSKAPAGSGPNPYSDCGIGAALFKSTKWAAVTSNVIWDLGLTAITSATMSPETCSGKQVEAALFIRDTYPVLVEDVARGSGEHLATALGLFECGADRSEAAAARIRSEMAMVVSKEGYAKQTTLQKASDLYDVMNSTAGAVCKV